MNTQLPPVRATDPETSQQAAERVRPSRKDLHAAIRRYVAQYPCSSAFDIADGLIAQYGDRWDEGSIRTAIHHAGVEVAELRAISPRGGSCQTYYLPTTDTPPL